VSRSPGPVGAPGPVRVVVVGSGWHFLSGISYYTCRLSNALAERFQVSAILMRHLLPAALYPGRARVGRRLSALRYASSVQVFDGVDWYGVPSLARAVAFLRRCRPDILVLQWWTGTVLHSYLVLGLAARLLGARVVIEFHEAQDTGEARYPGAATYVRRLLAALLRLVSGVVVHSRYDQAVLGRAYDLAGKAQVVAHHGPYDHHRPQPAPDVGPVGFPPGPGVTRLLFFGTIRPYKGLEDLIEAFHSLSDDEADRFTLTVVGETWEGWTLPATLLESSPRAARIRFVNRYVTDAEVTGAFAAADAVVLPYRRSSASGPLHIAMSEGLPVVVSTVGGLVEAVSGYDGALLVPPADPRALADALRTVRLMTGRRYRDPHSWAATVDAYAELFTRLGLGEEPAARGQAAGRRGAS
jgi:glycosyltransferase involved in cell wall biosynthesis